MPPSLFQEPLVERPAHWRPGPAQLAGDENSGGVSNHAHAVIVRVLEKRVEPGHCEALVSRDQALRPQESHLNE